MAATHHSSNFDALLDAIAQAPVILHAMDKDGRFVMSEGKGLALIGLAPGDVVGTTAQERYRDNPVVLEQCRRALAGEYVSFIAETPLGSDVFWQSHWTPKRDATGALDGAVGFAYDVSDHIRTDEKLRAREHELRLVLNHAPVILFRVDRHGVVTFSEGRGLAALGLKPGETVGRSIFDMYPDYVENNSRAIRGEQFSSTLKVGDAWLHTEFTPVFDGDGAYDGSVGVCIDVTAQMEYQSAAESAIKSRDEFLSIVAHELRTPLAALSLSVANLLRIHENGGLAAAPPERVTRSLASADRQVTRLDTLVEDLLDVSRIRGGRLSVERGPMRLDSLVHEVVELFSEKASSMGCAIDVCGDVPITGDWDRARIEQVVTNLVSNALKYGKSSPVKVTLSANEDSAQIEVADQGIGIAADELERIFKPFERAVSPRNYGGLGLGLYIVHEVVMGHGGKLNVESEPGRGSKFIVQLPLHA